MARKMEGSLDNRSGDENSVSRKAKKKHIASWTDEKILDVWRGREKGEYELGEDDIEILESEMKRRKLEPSDAEEEIEEEQVPIGYIRIYPDTPERNEFYRKRYANAKKAWPDTEISRKSKDWYIVTKTGTGSGYDVHLFFTGSGNKVHGTCTCADFSQRGIRRDFPCKHIFMVLVHSGHTEKWPDID